MGAAAGYCPPVQMWSGVSTWRAHTNRGVPSTEPGTDFYCPRGTPVRAAASGRVVDVGDSIQPATGRFVTIDLDDGRRVRYLHLERRHVNVGDRVQWGQHIADSGATGYGEADWSWNVAETGGAHVHMTLWSGHYYSFGRYTTLDPEPYLAPSQPAPIQSEEDDDMKLIRWNSNHVFAVGREAIYHIPDAAQLGALQAVHGSAKDVDNTGLTSVLLANGIHWDAVDAVLRGLGNASAGKYWSRLTAEGVAIRGNQAAQSKTLEDVLKTAKSIQA